MIEKKINTSESSDSISEEEMLRRLGITENNLAGLRDLKVVPDPDEGGFVRVDIGLYPISRYNRRIDAGYLHFCPINITFKWVMNKTPRKMHKTKRPPMYKSAVIKSYIS